MKLETFSYDGEWTVDRFPALDSPDTLVIAFCARSFDERHHVLAELIDSYPTSCIVGCSTSGEIHARSLRDESISVAVARFERARVRLAAGPVEGLADSFRAGQALATELAGDELRAVFVLSDGLHVNGSELARGLGSGLADDVVVTGGLAGDGDRFERTWVLVDGRPTSGWITAVGLYGERLAVGHGSRGGWDIFGPQRVVTRSEGSVLYELDDRPALTLYKEYLGELAEGLPATGLLFPLLVEFGDRPEESVVRTILSVDERAGSLTYAGDIPRGALAQLMRANFDRLIDGASDAGSVAAVEGVHGDTLAIDISCVGRRLVLGERSEEEIEAVADGPLGSAHHLGFYSYGELSPLAGGACDLHNQTMTVTTLGERDG